MRIYRERYRVDLDDYINKWSGEGMGVLEEFEKRVDDIGKDRVVSIQEVIVGSSMYYTVWYWGDE